MCARVDQLLIVGDKLIPPLMSEILMGIKYIYIYIYEPLRTWVDEFIPYYILGVYSHPMKKYPVDDDPRSRAAIKKH